MLIRSSPLLHLQSHLPLLHTSLLRSTSSFFVATRHISSSAPFRSAANQFSPFSSIKKQSIKMDPQTPTSTVATPTTPACSSPTAHLYLTRPGLELSEMDEKQLEYMKKDLCILVNRLDQPIGSATKVECHENTAIRAGKALHRAFSVFLFNAEGKLLLQRRAGVKVTFPKRWTNTCCSHPLYGTQEAQEEGHLGVKLAAIRKLEDELGLTGIKPEELKFLTRVHYCAMSDGRWGEHEIDHLMFLQLNQEVLTKKRTVVNPVTNLEEEETYLATPAMNYNEVMEVAYVSPDELRAHFVTAKTNPEHLTPWFQMISEQLLFNWWENGQLEKTLKAGGLGPEEEAKIRVLTLGDKPDTFIPEATP